MKLQETAELLSGLAQFLDKHLKTEAGKDLRAVSDCFRQFGDESTAGFCQFVLKAKEGKASKPAGRAGKDEAKIAELVHDIQSYLQRPNQFDYPSIRALSARANQLKIPEIKEVGEAVGCPLAGTKAKMVDRLGHWLTNFKMSLDQSSFSLVGTAAS